VEKMKFSLKTSNQTYGLEVSQRTYGLEPGCMVQSMTGNFIFTSCPIAPISLLYSFFSRNITNDRSFFSIRSYKALRELHREALRSG
jgi:hypothetical protein